MRAVRVLSAALLTLGLAAAPRRGGLVTVPGGFGRQRRAHPRGDVVPHRDGGRAGADRHGTGLHG